MQKCAMKVSQMLQLIFIFCHWFSHRSAQKQSVLIDGAAVTVFCFFQTEEISMMSRATYFTLIYAWFHLSILGDLAGYHLLSLVNDFLARFIYYGIEVYREDARWWYFQQCASRDLRFIGPLKQNLMMLQCFPREMLINFQPLIGDGR